MFHHEGLEGCPHARPHACLAQTGTGPLVAGGHGAVVAGRLVKGVLLEVTRRTEMDRASVRAQSEGVH